MMKSIQLKCYLNKPNSVNGKFAPIEIIVYKLPTINDCIALLPRDIGNHILSFTNAWLEWYLENIRNKYGEKFIIEMLVNMMNNKFKMSIFNRAKYRKSNVIISYILQHIGSKYYIGWNEPIRTLTRDSIRFAFEDQLVLQSAKIVYNQQRILEKKQEYDVWFNTLQVGDIIDADKLVLSKTNKSYRYVHIEIVPYFNQYGDRLITIHNRIHIGRTDLHISPRKPIKIKVGETIIDFDDENPIQQIKTL